ncbi:MAG: glycosyltransferase family 2 protein, partial [Fretibacterium sp.]|nr:glycosyltransferase family 2 protein [Fretibacterium sp.]
SVIIPAYNVAQFLERCLDSILAQDYEEIELVVVNDGSTDGTRDILARYAKLPCVTYIEQENSGLAKSRHMGLQASKGEFISFVDSDDYIDPNMLSSLYERVNTTDADVALCGWHRVVGNKIYPWMPAIGGTPSRTGIEAVNLILSRRQLSVCNCLFRRTLFHSIDFDEISSFRMGEDALLLFNVFLKAEKVVLLDEPLYFYTVNPHSLSNAPSLSGVKDYFQAHERIFQSCLARPHEAWERSSIDDFYSQALTSSLHASIKVRPSSKEEGRELRLFQDETKKKILSFPLGHMTKKQRLRARLHVFLIKMGLLEKAYVLWTKTGHPLRRLIKKMI